MDEPTPLMDEPTPRMDDAARYHYQLRLAVTGRIRFLSHLETVDTLLSAMRRAGVDIALSQGMKPKPLIKVAMPRPVGVESWSEVVEIETPGQRDPDEIAFHLSQTLPEGLVIQSVHALEGHYRSAASRVTGATYRVALGGIAREQAGEAVERFTQAVEARVERRAAPRKPRKVVNVRPLIDDMRLVDPASEDTQSAGQTVVRYHARLTPEGSARPDEVVRAIGEFAGCEIAIGRIVREEVTLADRPLKQGSVEPALVGADVPEGPAKPWGAC